MNRKRLLQRLRASSVNVSFADMTNLVEGFGFRLRRVTGSYHIFKHPDVPGIVNLQNEGGKAKPYQVRQFLKLVDQHSLRLEDES